jgi:hypothetical protein
MDRSRNVNKRPGTDYGRAGSGVIQPLSSCSGAYILRSPNALTRRPLTDGGFPIHTYVDQILRGAKPGDLPVQTPTKYETVLNSKTVKNLGLIAPEALLVAADEIIE